MKKLYLIDGSGYLYRAYYAFPEMPDRDGHNINVVYGFFRMILKLFHDKPDYFVIARDDPTKTHRHEIYPEYKANRVKAPDDFKAQIPIVQELVNKLNIPNLIIPGYEADDIIASIVKKHNEDSEILFNIFSADKDLKQLLNDNVIFTDPSKGTPYKTKDFIQEFLFQPENILDYLALIGDSADNIKGVPGIGPKGAGTLIQKYQNIENIYQHIDEISGGIKEKLLDGKEEAFKSKDLISLLDVPEVNTIGIEDYRFDIDFNKYNEILVKEQNFVSMEKAIKELKNKFQMPQQTSLF
ncbi:MAG TPA: 5'-3' exonuclease H3TH domain-containing protein [Candidatus Absconditabacterales bacterium]|nr:5'-3' exonuclease H3TH domain-containing protein [Candidatus Absconditabacterales bacterium]HPK27975.1 5'-3' exonuclease H3TH domain-containing protein [Candidatus Absconditabacterales bacterium]